MPGIIRATEVASGNITTAQKDTMNWDFTVGSIIEYSDINYLRDRINDVCGHTHQLRDYSKIADYGNSGSTASTLETTLPAGYDITNVNVSSGELITASHFNWLRIGVNGIRAHNHGWDDGE